MFVFGFIAWQGLRGWSLLQMPSDQACVTRNKTGKFFQHVQRNTLIPHDPFVCIESIGIGGKRGQPEIQVTVQRCIIEPCNYWR